MSDNILKEIFLFVPKYFSSSVLYYKFMEVSQGKRPHRNYSILPCETLPCDILPCDMLPCDILWKYICIQNRFRMQIKFFFWLSSSFHTLVLI